MTKKDKWDDIFRALGIDCTRSTYQVTAAQIKKFANEEPRLMASMDSEDKRPDIFRRHGLFILPVASAEYILVKGNGYHALEDPGEPRRFEARFEMDRAFLAYGKGENGFLLQARHSGLLEAFAKVPWIREGPSGKVRSGQFSFRVNETTVEVKGAGIEIDRSYISPESILIFEAKAAIPRTFLIRQLYYPFRDIRDRLNTPTRAFFFAADQRARTYNLWEYKWEDPLDYEGIEVVSKGSFTFEKEEPPVEALESIEPDRSLDIVPQADDFQKVADYPFVVESGVDTSSAWSERYGIARRQGDYYREAAEALGLLTTSDWPHCPHPRGAAIPDDGREGPGRLPCRAPPADSADERGLRPCPETGGEGGGRAGNRPADSAQGLHGRNSATKGEHCALLVPVALTRNRCGHSPRRTNPPETGGAGAVRGRATMTTCDECGLIEEVSQRSCGVSACRFELQGLTTKQIDAAFGKAAEISEVEERQLHEAMARGEKQQEVTWQPKRPSDWAEAVRARRDDRYRYIRRWIASDPVGLDPLGEPDIPVIGFFQYADEAARLHVGPEHPPETTIRGLTGEEVEDAVLRKAIQDFHREMLSCTGEIKDEPTRGRTG